MLDHSPADILRYILVGISKGSLPASNQDWPISVNQELDSPDNTITIYDTTGSNTRYMTDRTILEHHGIQIRIRARDEQTGYQKSADIKDTLSEDIYRDTVVIGSDVYCVQCMTNISDVIPLYKESQVSSRRLWTINCQMVVKQVS